MLQIFADKERNKKIMIGIFICILPGFLLWGTSSVIKSAKEKPLPGVMIFGKRVPAEDLSQAIQAVRMQTMMQFGDSFSQVEKFLDFRNLAIERLILLHEGRSKGIRVTDEDVRRAIAQNPLFQRKGAFDPAGYEYVMRYVLRVQPRAFEEVTRQNLILTGLYDRITGSVAATDDEIRLAYEKQNEQVSISYIAGLPAEFQKNMAVEDAELSDYFAKNSEEFKEPISFNLEYLTFDSEPQAVGVSQILEKKDGFDKTAREMDLPISETGFFHQTDPVPGIGWANDMTGSLPQIPKGTVLPIRQIDSKYYAFRVKEIQEPFIPAFETVKDRIKEIVSQKKARALATEKMNAALAALMNAGPDAADFDKTAAEFGLKSSATDPFKFGSYIQGIGASDTFFTEAKKLKNKEFSSVIEIPGGSYIIKVKEIIPIDEAKFSEEKAAFAEKFLSQKKQEAFGAFVQELKKKAVGS